MSVTRRGFILAAGATAAAILGAPLRATTHGERQMYGLIGKITAAEGRRDALVDILLRGTGQMPGCLGYVVATDPDDANAIWITEVWDSEESHRASLALPSVQQAIAEGRPMIAGFSDRRVTRPVGGHGLAAAEG